MENKPPHTGVARDLGEQILAWLRDKQIAAGYRLPSERELAAAIGVSHHLVRQGLDDLVRRQRIEKRPRVGYYLRDRNADRPRRKLAVLVPGGTAPAWTAAVLETIARTLDPAQYLVGCFCYDPDRFEQTAQAIRGHGIEGVLIKPHRRIPLPALEQLQAQGVRIVGLHEAFWENTGIATFSCNRMGVLKKLVDGLIERGARRILTIDYTYPAAGNAYAAHEALLRHFRADEVSEMVLRLPNEHCRVDLEPLDEVVQPGALPEALIAPDEFIASQVFRRCAQLGIRVPDDLSLAACHDLTPHAHPVPLTAGESTRALAQTVQYAARHLAGMVDGEPHEPVHLEFVSKVIWRQSVAARFGTSHERPNASQAPETSTRPAP